MEQQTVTWFVCHDKTLNQQCIHSGSPNDEIHDKLGMTDYTQLYCVGSNEPFKNLLSITHNYLWNITPSDSHEAELPLIKDSMTLVIVGQEVDHEYHY